MKHLASTRFRALYGALRAQDREVADQKYQLLGTDHRHPSLLFKRIGHPWSVRIGPHHRAIGIDAHGGGVLWIWIGSHAEYDRLVGR